MKRILKEKHLEELKIITKCIFKGLTIEQIAKLLNYSKSTISNRIQSLFKKYKAKTRLDFILRVFNDVIEKNYILQKQKDEKIETLSNEIEKLKHYINELNKKPAL